MLILVFDYFPHLSKQSHAKSGGKTAELLPAPPWRGMHMYKDFGNSTDKKQTGRPVFC
jgi:hypothetical protein